jgi:hypothetical protein
MIYLKQCFQLKKHVFVKIKKKCMNKMEFRLKGYIFFNYFKLLKILQKNILIAFFFLFKEHAANNKKKCFSRIKKVHE